MPRAPSAVVFADVERRDHTRRRDQSSARPHQARQPRCQTSEELCRPSHARREEGGAYGQGLSGASGSKGRSTFGRGRRAALSLASRSPGRRVVVMARIVRHQGRKFRSAPLAKHVAYLKREGVTRDGADARMFDARSDDADSKAFSERCEDDRHHFRFTVSPENATEMADLRTFTRELMADAERDLDTRLDWVAVDHWNTDNPHLHILVRGRADDGQDLVISRDYISRGLRSRAEERVTLELGPRSEQEIQTALEKEVEAERWTGLDRALRSAADEGAGVADLRPGGPRQRSRTSTVDDWASRQARTAWPCRAGCSRLLDAKAWPSRERCEIFRSVETSSRPCIVRW